MGGKLWKRSGKWGGSIYRRGSESGDKLSNLTSQKKTHKKQRFLVTNYSYSQKRICPLTPLINCGHFFLCLNHILYTLKIFLDYVSSNVGNDCLESMDRVFAFDIIHHAGTFLQFKGLFAKPVIYIKEDLSHFFS